MTVRLTQKEIKRLWGDGGPYSQVNIVIQSRILDFELARTFVIIRTEINPLTFEIIKEAKSVLYNNPIIKDILEYSFYCGEEEGYVANIYHREYVSKKNMDEAKEILIKAQDAIIEMHKFAMTIIETKKITKKSKKR